MHKDAKIYIAGHIGLVGNAIYRKLKSLGYNNLLTANYPDLNLIDQKQTLTFFEEEKPDYVFQAAAKVGGIYANNIYPAQFYYENIMIQNNIIHSSYLCGVKRLLFLGSSCIYPKLAPQPIKEEHLLSGYLEPTNRPYAIAKIGGIEQCWTYNRQYGTRYIAAMPTNLYGPGDNYDLQNSHVLPAIIRKMHEAKESTSPTVQLWGTGSPYREFLFNEDLAAACIFLLNLPDQDYSKVVGLEDSPPLINIGSGSEFTIKDLAKKVSDIVGYQGEIVWDSSKPDGTPRKFMDSNKIFNLGWKPSIDIEQGIGIAYADFLKRKATFK
ncbi:MAG: GDP-L-fucose synthase [Phycisphaerae bacterium]|nr:GDP-L-fucose synthase [Phycisphaerae bacterium]